MRQVLLLVLLVLGLAPVARAASLPVRPARPADDVRHESSLSESWQVLAFDPASRTWVRIQFATTPWTDFELWIRQGDDIAHGVGSSGMGIAPQASPRISMVETSPLDPSAPPKASLVFTGNAYVVDVSFPFVKAHLTIAGRPGVTVGPWHLGREPVSWNPPRFVSGTRMWSVPVATGTATGWVDAEGHRLDLNGWRAYHDHTWGRFRPGTPSWVHSDFVVNIPRPGEAWIVNGLEPEEKGYRVKPDDSHWQGVLVHVKGSRVSTCSPRIVRSGWTMYVDHAGGWGYWLPNKVEARCAGSSFAAAPERVPWGLTGFMQALMGSTPIRGRSGWIEHATPVFPNV